VQGQVRSEDGGPERLVQKRLAAACQVDGGPIVCASKIPPVRGTRQVVKAHCDTTGCDSVFVFDAGKLVAYCCFDSNSFSKSDKQFADWAKTKFQGARIYTVNYDNTTMTDPIAPATPTNAADPRPTVDENPMVDCPPPVRTFAQLKSRALEINIPAKSRAKPSYQERVLSRSSSKRSAKHGNG